jgi:hypothetical protein
MEKTNTTKPGISKAEMRVTIAKDALQQLKAEKIIAVSGSYYGTELIDELDKMVVKDDDNKKYKVQAQPFLKKRVNPCRVCAKGALFLSAVRKYNKATLDDVMCEDLRVADKIFGSRQFDQIEAAFEQWETTKNRFGLAADGVDSITACAFGMKYEDERERLEAILKNIIKNNGTFKP